MRANAARLVSGSATVPVSITGHEAGKGRAIETDGSQRASISRRPAMEKTLDTLSAPRLSPLAIIATWIKSPGAPFGLILPSWEECPRWEYSHSETAEHYNIPG